MNVERITRLEGFIQREISDILMRKIKDPRVKMCTVSHVKITNDLSKAKIYLSIIGTAEEITRTMRGIESAKGFIRSLLGKNLQVRQIPELYFYHDTFLEAGDKMVDLIDKLVKDEERKKQHDSE